MKEIEIKQNLHTAKLLLTSLIRHSSLIVCNRLNSDSTENAVQPSCITSKSHEKPNGKRNVTSQVNPSKFKIYSMIVCIIYLPV